MKFVQIETRNGMINLDGYSKNKTLKGALKDLAREVAKIDEGEGKCISDYINETAEMVAAGMTNEPGAYYIEAQEVPCASRYKFLNGDENDFSEENVEMEYAEGHWYLYIRFCAPEQENEEPETSATEQVAEAGTQDSEESESTKPAQYAIFEGNMERLTKKLTSIQNKCRKYGCDFRFEEVGEEFREMKDENGVKRMARFVLVEAEGVAIVNGWRFIAKVEHTSKGNLINRACDIEVPARYYTSLPVCEHCNSSRARKDTYIVMNEETGEFKQVGKSCLRDFTHGMSAEGVAQYIAAFDELIKGEEPYEGCHIETYIETEEWLRYVAETIRHFGYVKKNDDGETCTRARATDYYQFEHGYTFGDKAAKRIREELEACGFNAESDEAKAETAAALAWLEEQDESNNYMHNLKTACALDYLGWKHLGITASLFPSHNRELARKEVRERQEKADAASEWCGEVGKRIEVDVAEMTCLTGWETQWGYTKIYKIVDTLGRIFTWKTSNWVEEGVKRIKGTVKAHNEYRGTKQTELTRCKCAA